jgi:hypothetical protein
VHRIEVRIGFEVYKHDFRYVLNKPALLDFNSSLRQQFVGRHVAPLGHGTKEDVLVMLVKRTEQCKKLESKISGMLYNYKIYFVDES